METFPLVATSFHWVVVEKKRIAISKNYPRGRRTRRLRRRWKTRDRSANFGERRIGGDGTSGRIKAARDKFAWRRGGAKNARYAPRSISLSGRATRAYAAANSLKPVRLIGARITR